jgi:hypothetical protein
MNFRWEEIGTFGSLRERDRFLAWMEAQIADAVAVEIKAPAGESLEADERWFRHIPSGSLWRLVSDENLHGPGFWPSWRPLSFAIPHSSSKTLGPLECFLAVHRIEIEG